MASSSSSSSTLLLAAVAALLFAHASAAMNLTGILDKGGQYKTFTRLLAQTQVSDQIKNQLNNSRDGFTVFAPTDNAFNNLPPGTLNSLSTQQQVELIQFHVVPKFYDFETIKTASNPIQTQAGGTEGFSLTVSASSVTNQFNVSTGVNTVSVTNAINVTSPLAVYEVDAVLQPAGIFGPKAPASSPSPPGTAPAKGNKAPAPAGSTAATAQPSAGVREMGLGGISMVSIGLMSIAVVLL